MRLRANQKARIYREVDRVFDVCGASFPVDLDKALCHFGIELREAHFQDREVSGCLFHSDGRWIVGVNITQKWERKQFTKAHELGHFILHQRTSVDTVLWRNGTSAQGVDSQEVEANAFAAQLLMPEDVIRQKVGWRTEIDEDSVTELQHLFGVSFMAMTIRLTSLGYFL